MYTAKLTLKSLYPTAIGPGKVTHEEVRGVREVIHNPNHIVFVNANGESEAYASDRVLEYSLKKS